MDFSPPAIGYGLIAVRTTTLREIAIIRSTTAG